MNTTVTRGTTRGTRSSWLGCATTGIGWASSWVKVNGAVVLNAKFVYYLLKISQGVCGGVCPSQMTRQGRQELPIFHGSSYCLSKRKNGEKQNEADRQKRKQNTSWIRKVNQ